MPRLLSDCRASDPAGIHEAADLWLAQLNDPPDCGCEGPCPQRAPGPLSPIKRCPCNNKVERRQLSALKYQTCGHERGDDVVGSSCPHDGLVGLSSRNARPTRYQGAAAKCRNCPCNMRGAVWCGPAFMRASGSVRLLPIASSRSAHERGCRHGNMFLVSHPKHSRSHSVNNGVIASLAEEAWAVPGSDDPGIHRDLLRWDVQCTVLQPWVLLCLRLRAEPGAAHGQHGTHVSVQEQPGLHLPQPRLW